jgi:hypothetical protein
MVRGNQSVKTISRSRSWQVASMPPKQAQAIEDYDDCAAFVTNHARGEINFLCQRGNDQEQNYTKRNNDVLANDRPRTPA